MQGRTIVGLALGTGILCLLASSLLVWYGNGWAASEWRNFFSSVLIEIGAAFFLVPAIVWLEQRLTKSIKDAQRSMTERYLDSSSVNLLGPNSQWERVHFEFARLNALYPTQRIELQYSTFYLQFQPDIVVSSETAQPGNRVFIYYDATEEETDFRVLLWLDGESGEEFLTSVRRLLSMAGVLPPKFPTPEEFFADLRRAIRDTPRRDRESSVERRRERASEKEDSRSIAKR